MPGLLTERFPPDAPLDFVFDIFPPTREEFRWAVLVQQRFRKYWIRFDSRRNSLRIWRPPKIGVVIHLRQRKVTAVDLGSTVRYFARLGGGR